MLRSSVLSTVCLLCSVVACGASAQSHPKQAEGKGTTTSDEPLVKGAVETDADLARVIREHYTKHDYKIRMRDGVSLFTSAYVPKDATASKTYPILMTRTPYSVAPYGIDTYPSEKAGRNLRRFAPSNHLVKSGYIIVHQDVRGKMMSEGKFVDVRPHAQKKGDIDESTDTFDTIDWLVKNVPGNNGRVGTWGISYPGFYAAQSAVDAHPALKAVSPQAPVTEWFIGDDFHHNGAFFLAAAFDFYSGFGRDRPEPTKRSGSDPKDRDSEDVYDFFLSMGSISNANTKYLKDKIEFWNDLIAHPNRDDFWKARDPRPFYKNATPAIMTVGGWYDAEDLWGALETYRAYETQKPKNENVLVMGPWRHGGWARNDGERHGDISFGQKTSAFYREKIELPFFERHLKGKKGAPAQEAWVFETGTNTWRTFAQWPPKEAKPSILYFHDGGKLSTVPPTSEGTDSIVSDPKKPVPYHGKLGTSIDADYMSGDQRFAARRPDVFVYQTPDLDADVTLAGPLETALWVSTTGTDADFIVKLVDVWPHDAQDPDPNPTNVQMAGYQELVRAEVMRGKFRNSYEKPEPFKPGEPTLVKFTLPDVSHTFRSGHKLMVQVQNSWFPLIDRNPQTFVDIGKAKDDDFKSATHVLFHGKDKPSGLKVTVLSGKL